MKSNNKCKFKFLFKLSFCFAVSLIVLLLPKASSKCLAAEKQYLSDIPYVTSQSASGWKELLLDKAGDGSQISVKIEGAYYSFEKGLWAHASSRVVYDLSNCDDTYDFFTAYIGLNKTAASSSNGVKFYIYTTSDENVATAEWKLETEAEPAVVKPGDNATFVKIDIRNAKFLKLVADSNGSNGNDHSVYADAKFIKESYVEPGEDLVPSIKTLDRMITEDFKDENLATNKEFEKILLQRELVDRVGNYALRKFLSESQENKEAYTWLTDNVDNLRLYMIGGTPEGGSYYNSLTQLSRLYSAYKTDFENTQPLGNKWDESLTYGDLYKKMAISLSLTHSQRVALWMQPTAIENQSDAVKRYEIYRDLHRTGKLVVTRNGEGEPVIDITPWFETLRVEEMRFVMNNALDDEETLWLNRYTQSCIDEHQNQAWTYLTPHPYMAYVYPNYANPIFHDLTKKDYWDEKFKGIFSDYNVSYSREGYNLYKVWMNFRNEFGTGAVCGGISKTGSNIRTSHGIPATVIGQPGHAALLYYTKDANGKGYWGIDNDVSGWTLSEKGERMLLGWGNASYSRGYSVVYMVLAQEAINDYDNLVKCEEEVMLAKVYKGNLVKQEEIYRKAIEIQPFNIDAWYGLINVYNANENKTEDDFYNLSEELAEDLKYFPLPMYHLTNLIKTRLTSAQNLYKFSLLQTRTLKTASQTPSNTDEEYYVYQPSVTRVEANHLLGVVDNTIATFSFDGENAGKIVLSSRFDGNGIRFDYSLDGKKTWTEHSFTGEEEHKLQLTQREINSITAENDIYVHIVGVLPYEDKNLYKIDITEQNNLTNLYANDLENRVIGVNLNTEWRYTENDSWTSYSVTSPNLTGNKTVQVRQAATGTKLASEVSELYNFTEDNQPDREKYIRVSHLSIEEYSTQSADSKRPFYAPNAIDGNLYTMWHTDFRYSVLQQEGKPFITIKLDEARYISALEFIQTKYRAVDPDFIKNLTVYISNDGEEWIEAGKIEDCPQTNELRKITFEESVYGEYVKLEIDTYDMFASLAMVNLFEDTTKIQNINPTAGIYYSTQETTNEYVVARLVNPSTEITITNNDGKDTYVFTENGEFTFTFEDARGNTGSATAKVSWIDKNAPTADIKYELDSDKKLLILLEDISEDVYLLDENNNKINYVEVENGKVVSITYLDSSGNVYKTIVVDENGKTEKIIYKNTTGEVQEVDEYVVTLKTTENEMGEVEKEEYFDSDGRSITITDEAQKAILRRLQQSTRSNPLEYALEQSGEYEFRLLDKANNIAYKNIKVDYIENDTTILASDITYNITKTTNKDVVATIKPYIIDTEGRDANVEIVNNNKNTTYTFVKNGSFTFEYKDASDTNNWEVKSHTAKVTWIDKDKPTASIKYSSRESTDKPVVATLVNESESIIIINNGMSRDYTFTKNGRFIFEFEDKAGNKGSATAEVDWIKKEPDEPDKPDDYKTGDINNDGKITSTDLLLLKRHLVAGKKQEWILTENRFNAGDINKDGKITATDLIQMKRLVLKQLKPQ